MQSPHKDEWLEAERNRVDKVYTVKKALQAVPAPPPRAIELPGKWVYAVRKDNDGLVTESELIGSYLATGRSLVLFFTKTENMHLMFLSMAAILTWPVLMQWDVIMAYLNAAIDGRILLMRQPSSHEKYGPNGEELVADLSSLIWPTPSSLLMARALHKQSAKAWLPTEGLVGFLDAFIADTEDNKSTEGYVWFCGGAPVSWTSRRKRSRLNQALWLNIDQWTLLCVKDSIRPSWPLAWASCSRQIKMVTT
ncbi:hypothetical protein N7539_001306 [Penicillium diatomitis]|uniref:Reverse transcriptase Ty1/copia-type domain-containing protein n=1 Tax=Penicillium diatomitis TaxID=2819901 RepID=A0A9W9XHC8_9EURO|nr:uncharacterized protein N7539_001306 [Penicillium diatomitis]KAJ5492560.1 hypothetical protein N7539_001306 [Penicillium diatomitis]